MRFHRLLPVGLFDDLMATYWRETKKSLADIVQLQAVINDEGTFASYDGSLVSFVEIHGTRTLLGAEEHSRQIEILIERWNNLFHTRGYALQMVWESDPTAGAEELAPAVDVLRQGAKRFDLDVHDLLAERQRTVGNWISRERTVLALWTRPSVLSREQTKSKQREYKGWSKFIPSREDAQNPYVASHDMLTKHRAYVSGMLQGLKDVDTDAELKSSTEALDELNYFINGEYFGGHGQEWERGDDDRVYIKQRGEKLAGLQATPLLEQLIAEDPEVIGSHLKMGRKIYAPMDIQLGPKRVPPYAELVSRVRDMKVPVRLSLLFESAGVNAFESLKNVGATIMSLTNSETALRVKAFNAISEHKNEGRAVPRVRGTVTTWADASDEQALRDRKSLMTQIIQGWGDMVLSRVVADPMETWASTVPGIMCASTATPGLCDFRDMLRFIPTTRPRSIDREGGMSLRSPDGKHVRYTARTAGFNADLISGLPGQGKSVLLSALSLSTLLSSTSKELPYDATIDVGGSVAGYISTVREALPPHQRHMANFFRLENDKSYCCNILDTQLGHRFPLRHEKAFQIAFYTRLLSPDDGSKIDGLRDIVAELIDEVYLKAAGLDPRSEAKFYVPGNVEEIDDGLRKYGINVSNNSTWWDVVDALFHVGAYREAGLAQRFAVPVMRDLASALNSEHLQNKAKKIQYSGTERVYDAIKRILEASIRAYPILSEHTAFDVAHTRIIGIDVEAVAPQDDTDASKKQTGLMYMVARWIAVRNWWIPAEALTELPAELMEYHGPRIRQLLEVPKTIKYDEAHRASGLSDAILLDIRETRKKNFHVVLGSQLPTDFSKDIRDMVNRHWLMSAGVTKATSDEIIKVYGFSEAIAHRARTGFHKPDRRGAALINVLQGDGGTYVQHLYLTLGPMELWAYSTEPKDAAFRRRLEEKMSPVDTRRWLARRFPGGSILKDLNQRRSYYEQRGMIEVANDDAIMTEMVEEILEEQRKERMSA